MRFARKGECAQYSDVHPFLIPHLSHGVRDLDDDSLFDQVWDAAMAHREVMEEGKVQSLTMAFHKENTLHLTGVVR